MNKLKKLRIEKELLQSDIATIINKSERTVGFYENNERDMGTETLSKLSDFFNVSIDYILGKTLYKSHKEYEFETSSLVTELKKVPENLKSTLTNIALSLVNSNLTEDEFDVKLKQELQIIPVEYQKAGSLLARRLFDEALHSRYLKNERLKSNNQFNLNDIKFASIAPLDLDGLNDDDIKELQRIADYMKNRNK